MDGWGTGGRAESAVRSQESHDVLMGGGDGRGGGFCLIERDITRTAVFSPACWLQGARGGW